MSPSAGEHLPSVPGGAFCKGRYETIWPTPGSRETSHQDELPQPNSLPGELKQGTEGTGHNAHLKGPPTARGQDCACHLSALASEHEILHHV